jgi:ribose 5-phosphate isomerase B
VHAAIRRWLTDRGAAPGRVIYGGSINLDNAPEILATPGVDGLFVGRAALDPRTFAAIARAPGPDGIHREPGPRGPADDVAAPPRLAIGADEIGYPLKVVVAGLLDELGVAFVDVGVASADPPADEDPVDYPDVAARVALGIRDGRFDRGILCCGTGIGMAIAANKVPGVRAAQAHDAYSAERARKSNDAQILTMGSRVVGPEVAKSIVRAWLASEFAGGGSARKVHKIERLERELAR